MADYPKTGMHGNEEESSFDLKKLWTIFYLNWYWVLISVVLCVSASLIYLRYKVPVYSASMKMLVKDSDKNSGGGRGMGMALDELGLMSNSNGFENELEILCSASLSTKVVKNLKLYVKYFLEGAVVDQELYKTSPILLDLEETGLNALQNPLSFVISKSDKGFRLDGYFDKENPKNITFTSDIQHFPDTIATPYGMLYVSENAAIEGTSSKGIGDGVMEMLDAGKKMHVTIYAPYAVGRVYSVGLRAAPTSKTTTVANVGMNDTKPQRALDFLRELVLCYNDDANEDKNEIARKTEEFISERLESIKKELDVTEGNLESYKKSNELINLANDATSVLASSETYRRELAEAQTQYNIMKILVDYMDNPANYLQVIPANLGLQSTAMVSPLINMMNNYNEKVLTRNRYLRGSGEDNPLVVQITTEISDMWSTIRSNMKSVFSNMEMQKKALEKEYSASMGRIQKTPTQERMLTGIARQQSLQSGLYLTLLQKREENFIQLYSTAAKGRIIDAPVITGKVSPKGSVILLAALIFGIGLPIGLLLLKEMLRFKINGREDIKNYTSLSILADIPVDKDSVNAGGKGVAVSENRNNVLDEAFRNLRTNVLFCLKSKEQVIISTSCIPGEGKTFVSANLAMSLACLGKKVILVGLDVRIPRLVSLFGLKPTKQGIVSFLCTEEPDYDLLDSQIIPSGCHKNMDVLPAGIIPPNPAELIGSSQLDLAVKHLREKYDYVILDTPPLASVSDTLSIGRVADLALIVLRADYSLKANMELINYIADNNRLPKCNLVLNYVDISKRSHTIRYGSYGHYGYGTYTYGQNNEKAYIEK